MRATQGRSWTRTGGVPVSSSAISLDAGLLAQVRAQVHRLSEHGKAGKFKVTFAAKVDPRLLSANWADLVARDSEAWSGGPAPSCGGAGFSLDDALSAYQRPPAVVLVPVMASR